MVRRAALALAVVALAAAFRPGAHDGRGRPAAPGTAALRSQALGAEAPAAARSAPPGHPAGLGPTTAFVTALRLRRTVRLDPKTAAAALDAVWRILDHVETLAPQRDGPRLLANLRVNEYLLDVTVWKPQALFVAGRHLTDVSGIVIPFTGAWRNRVLLVREGDVEASPALLDSLDLAALERTVESAGGYP